MQCNHNWNSSSYLWILTNWFKSLYKEAKDPECCSVIKSWLTLCNPMNYSTSGFPVLHCLPEFAQTNAHCVNDTIQPSHPLSSLSLLARNLSQHQGFSKESALHIRRPKYWSFSFSPSSEYSGLSSFRTEHTLGLFKLSLRQEFQCLFFLISCCFNQLCFFIFSLKFDLTWPRTEFYPNGRCWNQ